MKNWRTFFNMALVLMALAALYNGRPFIGAGPTPTRSAFAGRLPGVMEGNVRRFQFFYTTNRENSKETFEAQGNQLGDTLLTGTFDVLISPYMPIQPFVWFDKENMNWGGHHPLPQPDFQSKLRQAVQASPHKSLVMIVWGFRDWFQSAALKTAYTAYALDIDTPVLLFDWPGNQGDGSRGYAATQALVPPSAKDLAALLAAVLKDAQPENLWLMGSSLGCQTICDAIAELSSEPKLLQGAPKIAHVVLSAPDVAADAFNEKFASQIQALSTHLTAYVSSNDRALLMSHWLNGGRRLGRKAEAMTPPADRTTAYEFETALELLDLQAKGAHMISVVDATPINRTRNLHHFFTDSPEFFDDLYQRLLKPDEIVSRRLHPVRTTEGTTYSILWNY